MGKFTKKRLKSFAFEYTCIHWSIGLTLLHPVNFYTIIQDFFNGSMKELIHEILLDFTKDLSYAVYAGAGGNNDGNYDHWAPNPTYSSDLSHHGAVSTCTSSDRPPQPEIERASYQGNNMEQIDPLLQPPHFTSPSDLGRRWHYLRRRCYHQQRNRNFSFTVVSYNVLADGLLYSNSHLYSGSEEWVKHWEYRRRNLLKELSYYNADVSELLNVKKLFLQRKVDMGQL